MKILTSGSFLSSLTIQIFSKEIFICLLDLIRCKIIKFKSIKPQISFWMNKVILIIKLTILLYIFPNIDQ